MRTPDFGNSPDLKKQAGLDQNHTETKPSRLEDIQIYMSGIDSLKEQEKEIKRKLDRWVGTDSMRVGYEDELEGIRTQITEMEGKINSLRN